MTNQILDLLLNINLRYFYLFHDLLFGFLASHRLNDRFICMIRYLLQGYDLLSEKSLDRLCLAD